MINLDFLEQVTLFEGLNDNQLEAVGECCQEKQFKRGETLFTENDPATYLWVLEHGKVDLCFHLSGAVPSDVTTLSTISEKMSFGWSSLVPPCQYTLSAYCASRECKVLAISREAFMDLFGNDTVLGYKIMSKIVAMVADRFHRLQEEIATQRGHEIMHNW